MLHKKKEYAEASIHHNYPEFFFGKTFRFKDLIRKARYMKTLDFRKMFPDQAAFLDLYKRYKLEKARRER